MKIKKSLLGLARYNTRSYINILEIASSYGEVIVGLLTDEAVLHKKYTLLKLSEEEE